MRRFTNKLFFVALVLSLFMHLGAGLVVYLKRVQSTLNDKSVEITVIENRSKEENRAKQIVEQSEKRINDELDSKAKYLSRYNQRIAEETKAANPGKFQNDAKMGEVPKKSSAKSAKKPSMSTSPDGDIVLPKLSDLTPKFKWDKMPSVENPGPLSQSDDFLKNLKSGPQTLLTTREFVYYSYYTRIKERLRLFWEPKIKEKINRLFASGRRLASDEEKITRLIIVLDKEGHLIKVQVLGPSGVQDLDDAAVEAFEAAAPFPNPPRGIIEPDGTIKIRWDFILEAEMSYKPQESVANN